MTDIYLFTAFILGVKPTLPPTSIVGPVVGSVIGSLVLFMIIAALILYRRR